MVHRILKIVATLFVLTLIVGTSALLATMYATRQISVVIQHAMMSGETQHPEMEQPVTLNFYQATGIGEEELQSWFQELETNQQMQQVRVMITLHNQDGHCLVNSPVALQWKDGVEWSQIDSSGVAEFAMSAQQLEDLSVIVPAEYTQLRQRTIPLGTQYEKPGQMAVVAGDTEVINDDAVQQNLLRHLLKARGAEPVIERLHADNTMRRSAYKVVLEGASNEPRSPDQIYELRSRSVVVIGFLQPNGQISQGTGFIVNSSGVIVTNFHVIDKPQAVAAGVLTYDHRFFEIREFLAGSPSDDLALIRVDGDDLSAIPLAERDASVGSGLLAITHPESHYFSMTFGQTTRYFQKTRHAMPSLRMGVTADFSEGSSGGPLLDSYGNVVGVVSAIAGNHSQMLHREAVPVSSLRRLAGYSDKPTHQNDTPAITLDTSRL